MGNAGPVPPFEATAASGMGSPSGDKVVGGTGLALVVREGSEAEA